MSSGLRKVRFRLRRAGASYKPRRLSDLCKLPNPRRCFGLAAGVVVDEVWSSSLFDDFPIGAGMDAPRRIPSGSVVAYDVEGDSFVIPSAVYRD